MNIRVFLAVLLGFGVLAGCVAPPAARGPMKFAKPGGTNEVYQKDRYECLQEAKTHVSSGFAYGGVASTSSGDTENAGLYIGCLSARGWIRDDVSGFGPPDGGTIMMR